MTIIREDTETNAVLNSKDLINQDNTYMNYLAEHRANVKASYMKLFFNNEELQKNENMKLAIRSIANDIENHDISKYSDEEWYAYRIKWYPTAEEEERIKDDTVFKDTIEKDYEKAWTHHFTVNDHHPKHWMCDHDEYKDTNEPKDMMLGAIIHMICDWNSLSMKYHTNVFEWYKDEAEDEKKAMSERTKQRVETLLDILNRQGLLD